jgi:hypothetical protein
MVTCIYVGAVLSVMFVILALAIFVILLYVMFKLYLSCFFFLLFSSYGTVYIRVCCIYYSYLALIGFISYSYNVFLSKTSLEDPADPGSICTDQSVGNHCWYLGMAAVFPKKNYNYATN